MNVSDEIKIGDRFYPTGDITVVYTVSSVSRVSLCITHVTLIAEADQIAIRVSIGELQDSKEWVPA